jgi:chemotaxis protein MotB
MDPNHAENTPIEMQAPLDEGGGGSLFSQYSQTSEKKGLPSWAIPAGAGLLGVVILFGVYNWGSGKASALEETKKTLAETEKKMKEIDASKAELELKAGRLETDNAALTTFKTELNRRGELRGEDAKEMKALFDKLTDSLAASVKRGDVKLSQVGGRVKVEVAEEALFNSDEIGVHNEGQEIIAKLSKALDSVSGKMVQVSGHSGESAVPAKLAKENPTLWHLSASRAINVARHLQEKGGVSGKQLMVGAFAQYHPVVATGTPSQKARNRRIELIVGPGPADKDAVAKGGTVKASESAAKGKSAKPLTKPGRKKSKR